MKRSGFGAWLYDHFNRDDAVGYISQWFFDDEGKWRRGRLVDVSEEKEIESYRLIILLKAAKPVASGLMSCFETAFSEYENDSCKVDVSPGKNDKDVSGCFFDGEVLVNKEPTRMVNVRSIIGQLTRTVKSLQENGSAHSEEHIDVIKYPDGVPIAHVRVDLKHTKNLGNWESVSANYSLSLPCFMPEMQDAFDFAEEYVSKRLVRALAEMSGENIEPIGKREIEFSGDGKDEVAKEEESPDPEAGTKDGQADEVASESDSPSDVTWESTFDPEKDDVGF